jgi:hypothetical protein
MSKLEIVAEVIGGLLLLPALYFLTVIIFSL